MAIASTLIGTYGLGALAILASGAILLTLRRQFRPAAALTAPLVALALWGNLSPAPPTLSGAPRIRVVQPNIGQDEKYSPELDQAPFQTLATLSGTRSEEHTSELQSLIRISYAVFFLHKNNL